MGKAAIPARLDESVNVVCPLYHDAFIRKRIGILYIGLYNVCHPVNESEGMF